MVFQNLTSKLQNERLWWLLGKPVGKGKMLDEETILSQGPKDKSYSV